MGRSAKDLQGGFDAARFAHQAEEDYDYHAGMMDYEPSLSHFVYGNSTTIGSHRWPKEYIHEVMNSGGDGKSDDGGPGEEHYNMVQHILKHSGVGETVTVRRTGMPKKGVTNVSLLPGWKSWRANQRPWAPNEPVEKTYEWEVPRSDIVAIGHPKEGEVFVKHPKGRAIREVND
jgi:hypothetical protein